MHYLTDNNFDFTDFADFTKKKIFQIITISTVEDFWALYNNIEKASNLNRGCDYALFKKGIKPMWEDHQNADGGKWLIQMDKRLRHMVVDKLWLKIMMCLIGESFGVHGQIINGAVVNIRGKQDKISVWLSESSKSKAVMFVGEQLKRMFDQEEDLQSKSSRLVFQLLKDSFTRESYAKTYDYQNYLK